MLEEPAKVQDGSEETENADVTSEERVENLVDRRKEMETSDDSSGQLTNNKKKLNGYVT